MLRASDFSPERARKAGLAELRAIKPPGLSPMSSAKGRRGISGGRGPGLRAPFTPRSPSRFPSARRGALGPRSARGLFPAARRAPSPQAQGLTLITAQPSSPPWPGPVPAWDRPGPWGGPEPAPFQPLTQGPPALKGPVRLFNAKTGRPRSGRVSPRRFASHSRLYGGISKYISLMVYAHINNRPPITPLLIWPP